MNYKLETLAVQWSIDNEIITQRNDVDKYTKEITYYYSLHSFAGHQLISADNLGHNTAPSRYLCLIKVNYSYQNLFGGNFFIGQMIYENLMIFFTMAELK